MRYVLGENSLKIPRTPELWISIIVFNNNKVVGLTDNLADEGEALSTVSILIMSECNSDLPPFPLLCVCSATQ